LNLSCLGYGLFVGFVSQMSLNPVESKGGVFCIISKLNIMLLYFRIGIRLTSYIYTEISEECTIFILYHQNGKNGVETSGNFTNTDRRRIAAGGTVLNHYRQDAVATVTHKNNTAENDINLHSQYTTALQPNMLVTGIEQLLDINCYKPDLPLQMYLLTYLLHVAESFLRS
jgi:hypothetical protein